MTPALCPELRAELLDAMREVPFGNSAFQDTHFVGDDFSAERRARTLLVNIDATLRALEENRIRSQRTRIEIDALRARRWRTFGRRRQLLDLDIAEKTSGCDREHKLIEDAEIKIDGMYREWQALPKFTRADFDAAERGNWIARLLTAARHQLVGSGQIDPGTIGSLEASGVLTSRTPAGQIVFTPRDETDTIAIGLLERVTTGQLVRPAGAGRLALVSTRREAAE